MGLPQRLLQGSNGLMGTHRRGGWVVVKGREQPRKGPVAGDRTAARNGLDLERRVNGRTGAAGGGAPDLSPGGLGPCPGSWGSTEGILNRGGDLARPTAGAPAGSRVTGGRTRLVTPGAHTCTADRSHRDKMPTSLTHPRPPTSSSRCTDPIKKSVQNTLDSGPHCVARLWGKGFSRTVSGDGA